VYEGVAHVSAAEFNDVFFELLLNDVYSPTFSNLHP
jgi:hypothetical protein